MTNLKLKYELANDSTLTEVNIVIDNMNELVSDREKLSYLLTSLYHLNEERFNELSDLLQLISDLG